MGNLRSSVVGGGCLAMDIVRVLFRGKSWIRGQVVLAMTWWRWGRHASIRTALCWYDDVGWGLVLRVEIRYESSIELITAVFSRTDWQSLQTWTTCSHTNFGHRSHQGYLIIDIWLNFQTIQSSEKERQRVARSWKFDMGSQTLAFRSVNKYRRRWADDALTSR